METNLSATITVSSSYGSASADFTEARLGGFAAPETVDIVHGGGTINAVAPTTTYAISGTTWTIQNLGAGTAVTNIAFGADITIIPEPSTTLLGACASLLILARRRR